MGKVPTRNGGGPLRRHSRFGDRDSCASRGSNWEEETCTASPPVETRRYIKSEGRPTFGGRKGGTYLCQENAAAPAG